MWTATSSEQGCFQGAIAGMQCMGIHRDLQHNIEIASAWFMTSEAEVSFDLWTLFPFKIIDKVALPIELDSHVPKIRPISEFKNFEPIIRI